MIKKSRKPFEGILGNTPELRLVEFLLPSDGIEFNIAEISNEINISRYTAIRIVGNLAKWGVLKTRKGKIKYYSIDKESPIVKSLEQFNNSIIENILGDDKLYEIHEFLESKKF